MKNNQKIATGTVGTVVMGTTDQAAGEARIVLVDSDGHPQVDILSATGFPQLTVVNAIDETAYDLNAAAFDESSSISNDYILDSIEMNFSTDELKTITVTTPDGTILYQDTNVAQSVALTDINNAFNASENFRVQVTQFGAAGTMDCIAVVREGSSTLGGNPSLGAGTEYVGQAGCMGFDGTDWQNARLDKSTFSLQTMGYEHHEIHSGSHYFVGGVQDLANGNVIDFTWLMPNTTKWTHWVWTIDTESETAWSVYETAVETNPLANAITPINSNRNSANTSGTTMKFELHANLAAANADTDVSGATLLDSGISGAGKDAGNAERSDEIVMKQNTLYCLRATANAAGYMNFHMKWYEHTDKA